MKVGWFCVSSCLCTAHLTMFAQALSSCATESAGGYLGVTYSSSPTACVTSCNPSSLHRCRYLAVRPQPRGSYSYMLAKLLADCCKLCCQNRSATAPRLPHTSRSFLNSRAPSKTYERSFCSCAVPGSRILFVGGYWSWPNFGCSW